MESEDYAFYQGLVYLVDNNVEHLGDDLTFSTAVSRYSIISTFTCSQAVSVITKLAYSIPTMTWL